MARRSNFATLGLAFVAVCAACAAGATPANLKALERQFDSLLPKSLRSCNSCHQPTTVKDPQDLDDIPHNAFGRALRQAGKRLKSEGKAYDIPARLAELATADSDGDGVDNLAELLLGHNPGDPKDKPTTAELATLPERRGAYAAYLKSYRWQPFEAVTRPAVPKSSINPINAFIEEQRTAHGLTAAKPAPKLTLLRRVYLDLVGLNPTPDEIAAYEADTSPDAYEKVVDRLLADPRYGQRWARHWMDVWRYSDWAGWSDGGQIRDSQPHIWRWRDWIVESLNADKGYDRMVVEMLAADEAYPEDAGALRATGFLARNYKMLSREQWLEDTVNHTSRAFLGLTMHCAKCHDHKFDPATQEEYYKLRAIFEPHNVRIDPVPGQADKKRDGLCRTYDKDLGVETMFFARGDERTPDKTRGAMTPGVPAFLGGALEVKPVALPAVAAHPDRRPFVREAVAADSKAAAEAARAKYAPIRDDDKLPSRQRSEAQAALAMAEARHAATLVVLNAEALEDAGKKDSPEWMAAATDASNAQRRAATAEAASNLIAAQNATDDARRKLDAATKAGDKPAADKATNDLKVATDKIDPAQKALAQATADLNELPTIAYKPRPTDDYPDKSTGRRLAFANWLVNPKNPLTARVAVNHLWARHFAAGLVPSVDDFGRNGRPATHPAMVDWLASELIAKGWHMKPIHRLIVTSDAYRQSSIGDPKNATTDPDDAYLWRYPSKRMEAEVVRDNVLWSAGALDLAQGGPEIDQALGLSNKRRSLYFRIAPEKEVEFLKVFDGPNPNECYFRRPSVIPQQALALANSQLVVEQAGAIAKKLSIHDVSDDFISAAFLRVLARPATAEELSACREFLAHPSGQPGRVREDLIVVLVNHNDFVTIR